MTVTFHTASMNLPLRWAQPQLRYLWAVRRQVLGVTVNF